MPMTMTSSSNSLAIFTTCLLGPAVPISCIHCSWATKGSISNGHSYLASLCGDPQYRTTQCSAPQQRLRCHHRNSLVCHLQGMLDSEEICALLCMDRVEEYSSSRPPATAVSVRTLQESFMKGKECCTTLLVRDTSNEQPYCKGRL